MDLWKISAANFAGRALPADYSQSFVRQALSVQGGPAQFYPGLSRMMPSSIFVSNLQNMQNNSTISTIMRSKNTTDAPLLNLLLENQLLKRQLQCQRQFQQTALVDEKTISKQAKIQEFEVKEPEPSAAPDREAVNEKPLEKTKKKKYRRLAKQIQRNNCCPVPLCSKSYGSEGSLHQHIRLKHPNFDLLAWLSDKAKQTSIQPEEKKMNSTH